MVPNIPDMDVRTISEIETAMSRRIASLPARIRPFTREYGALSSGSALPRTLFITGSRGVGKTTFLLHHARESRMLYFSADNPMLAGEPLYDDFPAHRLWVSDSSALVLRSGRGDTSRRFVQIRLLSVLDKTLYSDVLFFLPNITDGNIGLMKAITGTLAASLCADASVDRGNDKGRHRLSRIERDTDVAAWDGVVNGA